MRAHKTFAAARVGRVRAPVSASFCTLVTRWTSYNKALSQATRIGIANFTKCIFMHIAAIVKCRIRCLMLMKVDARATKEFICRNTFEQNVSLIKII